MVPAAAAAAGPQAQGVRRNAVITEEERRRNRMTSNRLSALKSRMKRQQFVDELTAEADRLRRENEAMRAGVGAVQQQSRALEQENQVLAAHARQLCATLLMRNSQLRLLGGVAGVPLDVEDVPYHLVQLYGGMPIMPLLPPPPPLELPLEIQMLLQQPDVMDGMLDL